MSKRIRLVAAALAICLLCGCTAKESTKKTKKTKKTKTTTEDTELDGSNITDPIETSDSNADPDGTSDPNADPNGTSDPNADPNAYDGPRPGSAELDSDEGAKSRVLYQKFLKDEVKVDITYIRDNAANFNGMDFMSANIPDGDLTYSELVELFKAGSYRESDDAFCMYGFLDCGLDGDPELLIQIGELGDFEEKLVIKAFEGKLKLTCVLESWSRSFPYIFDTGYVETDGSASNSIVLLERGVINAEGVYEQKAVMELYTGNFAEIDPQLAILDEKIPPEELDFIIVRTMIGEYGPFHAVVSYEEMFMRDDAAPVKEEIRDIVNSTDLAVISLDEMLDRICDTFDEGVCDGMIVDMKL
ncbi:MAG: hypothetical protein IK125_00945 [Lachnospiraceae bacterium]|nr:hypothetical protein [Lachnospiraceae bacterium]